MIQNWFIRGDTHGNFRDFYKYKMSENDAVIILGDAGFNTGHEEDSHKKNKLAKKFKGYVYCVRGNHELRPQQVEGMEEIWDFEVDNYVWYQPQWPRIRYFADSQVYYINGRRTLVIGGAYSVDKYYRIKNGLFWNPEEQLDEIEKDCAALISKIGTFDFIFSHTCPISWEPQDLFLSVVNQSSVDRTMENWMEGLREDCDWKIWCFGHYHADRCERPRVELMYQVLQNLETVWNRWEGEKTVRSEWWLPKSPHYYVDGNEYEVKEDEV